ncbi:hypothetical protein EPUS_08801 [Endocarpon pusillum Z07020]|uniref:Uncharacterized protein n=1 Tax=Endocarpon pusillum (strain Z07020 / HMAS-L-300199) TaxID=1263415 RepID=U1GTD0_ENDPU|nr:uncharacterized protein EPUS_08801 [Endocarpon pusillum Z07020]ERF75648.1 hypothetical protein EPUS_08801 [Endocarpon pusillum Z07020]
MPPFLVDEYHVGIICALPIERAAVRATLDEEHGVFLDKDAQDHNTYFVGRVHNHNVVIASLPAGVDGTTAAASVATDMVRTFKGLRFGLMEGYDIRLGDVVVSQPTDTTGGVVQYDKGKSLNGGKFQRKGSLNAPPLALLTALGALQADHESEDSKVPTYLSEMFERKPKLQINGYTFPGTDRDRLYCHHPTSNAICDHCDSACEVYRPSRENTDPQVHYGIIASGNQVVKDAVVRDLLRDDCGALCVEMEAAGLINSFPCIIIRGICDYADAYKSDLWQKYAATTAAAYTKELLLYISTAQTSSEKPIDQVLDVVKEHVQAVSDYCRKQEVRYQNDQDRKCHVAFKIDNYEQQKDINVDRTADTCQWVFKNEKYIKWHQSSTDSLLWISADPGCGKSVLSKSLVDYELQNTTTHTPASSSSIRYSLLLAVTADPKAPNVTCILDALDECQDDDRWRLINMLSQFHINLSSSHRRNNSLKFLVTSRPYDDIQQTFQKTISSLPVIRLRGEDENEQIRKEIDMVIRERVSKLAEELSLKPETKTRLEQKLLRMKHRTYLWLYLAISHVYETYRDSLRPDDESIESLPSSVETAYEKILGKVTQGVRETVKTILRIVVGARRPLTTAEMALALDVATSSHLKSAAEFSINKDHLERNICHWCGLFIFINHSKIYLIHQTAREFLICEKDTIRTGWKHCFDIADTEMHMSRICVRFLLLKHLERKISYELVTSNTWDFHTKIQNKSNKNVIEDFLLYSAEHWPGHLRRSEIGENDSLITEVHHLYDITSERFLLWFRLFWFITEPYQAQPDMNELQLAAFIGHDKVMGTILVDEDVDVNRTDRDGNTALMWASLRGHEKVVQMLLDWGADVNVQGGRYGNPLRVASSGGHEKVVQMLLDWGADVNVQGGRYGNPLRVASSGGHEKVVQMLLDRGAEINAQGGLYSNPLQAASLRGHEKVVQMLLDRGAEINAQSRYYGNALHAASEGGHEKVVQMLLDRGAEVNTQGGLYSNALQAASLRGHEKVVQMLLDRGAEVNTQGGLYSNALQAASLRGHEKVVQMLLDRGAEVNTQGGLYSNALQAASLRGHEKVVQMLLDWGTGIPAQGGRYGNPLRAASSGGHKKVVQMLLDWGADINVQGGRYGNPLRAASEEGHEKVVQMLLDQGAEINAQGGLYGNPLQAASLRGHEKVVQMLLDQGAEINAQGGLYGNPLQAASLRGHEKVVQMLLDQGAEINAQGGLYGNPLQAASLRGHEKVVQMLLDQGAEINAQGGLYGNPLQAASLRGHEKVVQMLLDWGADINVQGGRYRNILQAASSEGGEYGNVLLAASSRGHEKIVQMLLDQGAELNAQGGYYSNVLQAASSRGREKVVQMLLNRGAEINAQGGYYGNALQAASLRGHKKVV